MRLKRGIHVVVWVVVLVLVGLTVRILHENAVLDEETTDARRKTLRNERALDVAWRKAREVVRARLQRKDATVARNDAKEAVRAREAAQKRRAKAKRFFSTRGFEATASYKRAVEMPQDQPTAEDQEIIDIAGEAASESDLDTAADVLEAALASKDPRARLAAVEMLSGLGEAGLADISQFLSDPHLEVANLAADRWELGIQDLTDEGEQAALAKVGFLAIRDEDKLRSLGGTVMLISDAKLAVNVLTEVIRDGVSVQRAAAREAYESVTGEKWIDEKTAAAWLDENYVPPEPEEVEEEPMESETDAEETDVLSETMQKQDNDNESE